MATLAQLQQALQAAQAGGNAQDVAAIQAAMQAQPSRDQLSQAFYAAKAAGNEADARAIIGHIQQAGMTLAPMSAQQEQAAFQRGNAANVAAMPGWDRFDAGMGKAVMDTGRGIGQLLGIESPQDIQNAQQADATLANTMQGKLGDLAGQGLMLAMPGTDLFKGAGMLGKAAPYVNAALKMGAFSGAQPADSIAGHAGNAALGAGLGVAGEALPGVLGYASQKAAPALSAAKADALATAARYNIPLHLNQVTDSRFLQTLGSAAKYLPLAGTGAADNAQRLALNRALASIIGQNADELTPDVMNAARSANSDAYNSLFARNNVQLDDDALTRLADISQQAKSDLTPEHAAVVNSQIDKYLNAAAANDGAIPGRLYQNIRGDVQRVEGQNQSHQYLVGQVRKAMQDAASRSFGAKDAQALQGLNQQYSDLQILDKALGQAQGANYSVTPANLWRLANTKYGASPEMRALAQLGQTALKDPIQNSGTAQRMLAYHALDLLSAVAAGAMPHTAIPIIAGGATLGRFMNSPLAARILPGSGSAILRGASQLTAPAPRLLPLFATMPPSAAAVTPQQ